MPDSDLMLPKHIAIVMDGNGRWAEQRHRPRFVGHRAGVESVRCIVREALHHKVEALTLFAFGIDNWKRPKAEVKFLMDLFLKSLKKEIAGLHEQGVQFRVIGDRQGLASPLVKVIEEAEQLTRNNSALTLSLAINYSGQWDLWQATCQFVQQYQSTEAPLNVHDQALWKTYLSLSDLPAPDLFIRTSGEKRLSNFMLWQLSYAELYFTELFWPDFRETAFREALAEYSKRNRRFGYTQTQIEGLVQHA